MAETRRVLITGVSRFWGCRLAQRLERHPSIERIVAVDTATPAAELERTDFVRADIRHSVIGRMLGALGIDTVVHAGLIVDPQRADPRTMHETNVIGTMNLIAACSGADSPVRKLVVKSSTAVYGAEAEDPSIWSEDMPRANPRDTFTRDLEEVEGYVRDFSVRRTDATTTVLRFANVLGATHSTPFSRLFDRRIVPTVAGFDPRLQFVHEDDAVTVLEHAVLHDRPGLYNVAGAGVVVLSQAIATMGHVNAPVLPFVGAELAMSLLDRRLGIGFAPHLTRLLQYGRVVDTSALRERFGVALAHSTPETVLAYARDRRVRGIARVDAGYRYETELEEFLRAQRALNNGHDSNGSRPRRRRSRAAAGPPRRRSQPAKRRTAE
jgi:UDP-glucose 4-epimerase